MTKTQLSSQCEDVDDLLGQAVDEYLQAVADGKQLDVEQLATAYPSIANLIRRTLPALEMMDVSNSGASKLDGLDLTKSRELGDFRLLRELGSGGMGFVYEAEQLSMGRRVALKILPMASTLQHKALERFNNEVRAAAMLDHPNIVSIYSVGEERGVHYYAMQLIRGQSLAEVIRELQSADEQDALSGDAISKIVSKTNQQGSLCNADLSPSLPSSPSFGDRADDETEVVLQARITTFSGSSTKAGFFRSAAVLGVQAAEALQHAHEQGVFHRDIKPGNLMLDANTKPYLTDFGLARIEADAGITRTGDLVGTLRYMSPEQALAKRAVSDGRSDIYSLGVTLYELIGLRPLFDSKDRQELLQKIAFQDPVKLRRIEPLIPVELETIVHKAIEKSPDDRYLSAAELAADLQAFLDDRTIQAKPPTVSDKLIKWSRRHKPMVWTMAMSGAAMVTMAISALAVSNLVIAQERQASEQKAATANAVIRFITEDLLGAASPLNEPDRDIRLRTVVDRAAARIDDQLADQPLVAAEIRGTLGETYHALGEYTLGEQHFREALKTYTTLLGEEHRDTQECQRKLALVLLDQGHDAEAEKLIRSVFDARMAELGDQHLDTLESMSDVGELSFFCGQHVTARRLFGHVVEARLKQLGAEHPLTLDAQHRFAEATSQLDYRRDNVQEAESLFRQVLSQREKVLSQEHPHALETRFFLASLLLKQSKLDEAESEFRKLQDIATETLGATHTFTLHCKTSLASTFTQQRQFDASHQLNTLALQEAKKVLGEEHPLTLQIQLGLAANYAAQRENEQATQLYEQSLTSLRQMLGEHHPMTHYAKCKLLACYEAQGLDGKVSELREVIDSPEDLAGSMSASWFWGDPLSFRARQSLRQAEHWAELKALGSYQVPSVLNGFEATVLNGTRVISGKFGPALAFDGEDDRADIEDHPELAFTESMTIHCWLRIDSFPEPETEHGTIVMRSDNRNGRDPYFLTTLPSGEIAFGVTSLDAGASISAKAPEKEFIHVAASLDDSSGFMRLYINGQPVSQIQTEVRPFADLMQGRDPGVGVGNHFGIRIHAYNFPFHGVIEQLTITDTALSAEEIQRLAKEGFERRPADLQDN